MELGAAKLLELAALGGIAGGVGALTGIGGGLIIIPVLTLVFHVPILEAIGTSLCCVIATSSGAAASYVERHMSDVRLGMTLELATTMGGISGSVVAGLISRQALGILFAVLLCYAGSSMVHRGIRGQAEKISDTGSYKAQRLPLGLLGSGAAGMVSGLLGVGGGPIKVPVMYLVMGVPFKVATATSNFMIGVTAAASAFIYYSRGDVRLLVTAPTAVGVLIGASLGTHAMRRAPSRFLILLFSVIMFYFAATMIWKIVLSGPTP